MLAPRLQQLTVFEAAGFFAALNVSMIVGSMLLWTAVRWLFPQRCLFAPPRPLTGSDVMLTLGCLLTNVFVSVVGWWIWKQGWLQLAPANNSGTWINFLAMLIVMDLGMYVSHRIAHVPWIYRRLHEPHHGHVETNALSLFVLHPVEVFGFGSLLVVAIAIVQPDETALTMYLATNLIFGTLGLTGVEFFSRSSEQSSRLSSWDPGDFHALHHTNGSCNFGFYTPLWDRLFQTLVRRSRTNR